ncbi:5-formyltetrahydrofolate cyclo-ligase [Agrobacterium sp. NPDC090273]|uniref:5-formyltetrahydrofolate cyclo-ligase n=1 Tax=Agrobacterium sp. NPDC090273 TaxID=3363919 RepID=UPI00383AD887
MQPGVGEKARLRGERLAARDALTTDERHVKSLAMCVCGAARINFELGTVVSGFMPIRSEADIRPLLESLRRKGARLALPVVLDRETIVFRTFEEGMPLTNTGFGTTGPGQDAQILDPDILLVPLSAFDRQGHRIGYGAGHYDRAIARLHKQGRKPTLIGVAFDCQEVPFVPAEPHDVPLNAILTESGLRRIYAAPDER